MNNNKKTLDTYNKISNQYAKDNSENPVVETQRDLFYSLLKNGTVFDFGCGTGRDVYAFSKFGFDVTGFDASDAMLTIARESYPDNHFVKLDMLTDDWNLPGKADGVWACASLLHFADDDFVSVFKRILHHLNDNGVFYLSLKIKDTLSNETVGGRFFQYYTKDWLDNFVATHPELEILHYEENESKQDRFASYFMRKHSTTRIP